jgi:hypothetical protein
VSVVPLQLVWQTKIPCVLRRDSTASLTQVGYVRKPDYTLCPDNGGIPGPGYCFIQKTNQNKGSPCNSEVHSRLSCGQVLTVSCSLYRRNGLYSSSSQSFVYIKIHYTCLINFVKFFVKGKRFIGVQCDLRSL